MTDIFAYISDYGTSNLNEKSVADMVLGWNPDYILAGGDNIYGLYSSKFMTLAAADKRYEDSIMNYYGKSVDAGTFYPVIGNHDTDYDYDLPGGPLWFRKKFPTLFIGQNYYQKTICAGKIEIFALSSGYLTNGVMFEPGGNDMQSVQYNWFKSAIQNSQAKFKIVILHHQPYTSSQFNKLEGYPALRWDFDNLGVSLVLSGHSHNYERWTDKPIPYIVAGIGGFNSDYFKVTHTNSIRAICYGALKFTLVDNGNNLRMDAYCTNKGIFDSITLSFDGANKLIITENKKVNPPTSCFPANAHVQLENGPIITMCELNIGDKIMAKKIYIVRFIFSRMIIIVFSQNL